MSPPVGKIRFAVKPLGEGDITITAAVVVPNLPSLLRQSLSLLQSPTKPLLLSALSLSPASQSYSWGRGARALIPPRISVASAPSTRIPPGLSNRIASSSSPPNSSVRSIWVALLLPDLPPPPLPLPPSTSCRSRTLPCPSARPIHLSSSLASTPLPRSLLKPAAFLGQPVRGVVPAGRKCASVQRIPASAAPNPVLVCPQLRAGEDESSARANPSSRQR